jgi:hypothetical protein
MIVDARPRSLGGHHFLTTTGAADTRGCQLCCPGNPAGGYTESGLRLSWSSREHRQSHHPTSYYEKGRAKFRGKVTSSADFCGIRLRPADVLPVPQRSR